MGAANCSEGPGCGSVGVRPITAAHSSFSLLHLEQLQKVTDPEGLEVLKGSTHWTTPDWKKCLWLVVWGVCGGVLLPVCAKLRSYTQVPDDYSSFIMGMTSHPETLIHPSVELHLLFVKQEIPTLVPSHHLAWPPSDMCYSKVFGTSSAGLRVQLAIPSVAALGQASLRPWCWIWSMLRFA